MSNCKIQDKIFFESSKWQIDLGGVAGKVPIADGGIPSPDDFKYHSAGEQWTRVRPLASFKAYRFVENDESPTGVFFTPDNYSSTASALEGLRLTGWNNPSYKGLVRVNKPEHMDIAFLTGSTQLQLVVDDQDKINYGNFDAT